MSIVKGSVQEILERMRQAYGVSNNTALSERAGIPKSTISNWISRENIPFRYIFECSKATESDLDWLTKGDFANASFLGGGVSSFSGEQTVYNDILQAGGKSVLQRILHAYGFTTQKQLGDLLGLSSGTMSTWIRRDHFPGDVVVACALDTGVNLEWLATGKGEMQSQQRDTAGRQIEHFDLFAGTMSNKGSLILDSALIPQNATQPAYVSRGKQGWIVDMGRSELSSGTLLLNVDGDIDVYSVSKLPGNQIKACNVNEGIEFTCNANDVRSEGRVVTTLIMSA